MGNATKRKTLIMIVVCFYNLGNGYCITKNWEGRSTTHETWDGLESEEVQVTIKRGTIPPS